MEIKSAIYIKSSENYLKCPEGNLPEYAFIGRSNVGKSSLINMLTHRKKLTMTSSKPGKTLLINHFLINNQFYFVDLPGYGYSSLQKEKRKKLSKMIEDYILYREQLVNLFVLLDVRLDPQKIDIAFIEWLGKNKVPFSLIFTKIDKLSISQVNKKIQNYQNILLQQWEELPPVFLTSSLKQLGRKELLQYMENINKNFK